MVAAGVNNSATSRCLRVFSMEVDAASKDEKSGNDENVTRLSVGASAARNTSGKRGG
jgi:hypothetical protein